MDVEKYQELISKLEAAKLALRELTNAAGNFNRGRDPVTRSIENLSIRALRILDGQ